MFEYVAVKKSDHVEFAAVMQNYINDGWKVTWQGAGANGSDYSSVYMLATLERKMPDEV